MVAQQVAHQAPCIVALGHNNSTKDSPAPALALACHTTTDKQLQRIKRGDGGGGGGWTTEYGEEKEEEKEEEEGRVTNLKGLASHSDTKIALALPGAVVCIALRTTSGWKLVLVDR